MQQENFDDVQTGLAALCYYLYRAAECPYGDDAEGLQLWMRINVLEPFNQLAEKSTQ